MNYNDTTLSLVDTKLLQLQKIDKEINLNLCRYKQSVNDYLQNISVSKDKTLVTYPNMEFWGSNGIQDGFVNDEEQCLNMCLNNGSCSGATYDKSKKYCWARTGESQVLTNEKTVAIVSPKIKQIKHMKVLNDKILKLQQKKMLMLNSIDDTGLLESNETEKIKLDKFIKKINNENIKLNELLEDNFSNKRDYENSSLVVNKNTIYYNISFVLVIIAVFICIKAISQKTDNIVLLVSFLVILCLFFVVSGVFSMSNIFSFNLNDNLKY